MGASGHDVLAVGPATFAASNEMLGRTTKPRVPGLVGSATREFVRRQQPHRDRAIEATALLALEGLTTKGLDS